MVNQLMFSNQELNRRDIEISTLKFKLRFEKEVIERMKKLSKAVKYFEDPPKGIIDTTRLGYKSTTKKKESSRVVNRRMQKENLLVITMVN